ncbi:MAG TPA: hypothetical protein VMZ91_13945 [Candidatus Paceibacterota bacterium]|nr:hypothetical protein [Candidatus Paceibacterota bacterium]
MKSSQEIMNEIEEANQEWLLDRFSSYKKDKLSLLQAQKQERLDCYKKELEYWQQHITEGSSRLYFLKQEIKILEGEK